MNQDTASPLAEYILREAAELSEQRPIFWAIAERIVELARQKSNLPDHSPERKQLEKRFQKLLPYIGELPCYKSKQDQERMVLNFAQSLHEGTIGRKGRAIKNWEDIKFLTDEFQKDVRKRPRGNAPIYRHRITEALELRLQHPDWTWAKIAEDLHIDLDSLTRQITMLRRLLRQERIGISSLQNE
jgi:hypothetical protein